MFKIGIVGLGYWGPNLLRNFNGLSDCCVKIICDTNQERLESMKALYHQIETTHHYDDLVNDPDLDAIAIATPVFSHYELAKKSLLAGKHTFIEKPMASNQEQCIELNQIAEEKKLTLMIGHTFIYTTVVRKIKELILAGELGEIQYISSRRLNLGLFQKDINVAWDLAPHDISIINYLLDEKPISVNCQGKAHINPGIEDVTNITLDFPNGCFATIHSSWLDPNKVREMVIVGSKKMLVYNDILPLEKIRIYDKRVETPPHYDTFAEFHYSYHYGDTYSPFLKQVEPLKVECQHFIDCIRSGQKSDSSGLEGLEVVQILEASSHSLKNGGERVYLSDVFQPKMHKDK